MTSIRKVCKSGLSEVVATWYPGPFFIWKAAGYVSWNPTGYRFEYMYVPVRACLKVIYGSTVSSGLM